MKNTDIRTAVLDALEKHDTGATLFDGRPAVFDEADFPAVAVYLTDRKSTRLNSSHSTRSRMPSSA